MGRKRNQGKARKAAKAREAAEEKNRPMNELEKAVTARMVEQTMIEMGIGKTMCKHGADNLSFQEEDNLFQFVKAFDHEFRKSSIEGDGDGSLRDALLTAHRATMDEFADVWHDSIKLKMAVSYYLFLGTEHFLGGFHNDARDARVNAICARYLEQHIAVEFQHSRALQNWPKIEEMRISNDVHTLVKFFKMRIPCSCMDEKYQLVKDIVKIGFCENPECESLYQEVERSKTMYCGRCRCVTYCSRECQVAHLAEHKTFCDENAAKIAEFNADA